jgi:hypothetical protein
MRAGVVVCVAALAACGGGGTRHAFTGSDVEHAFSAQGIPLRPLPSRSGAQPAMGVTSPCATRYAATTTRRSLVVAVCDDARATAGVPAAESFHRTRANVVVEYSGRDAATQRRIDRALDDLG